MREEVDRVYRDIEYAIHSLRSFKAFVDWFCTGPLWSREAIAGLVAEFPENYAENRPGMGEVQHLSLKARTLIWNAISVQAVALVNSATEPELKEIMRRAEESGIGEFFKHVVSGDIRYMNFL